MNLGPLEEAIRQVVKEEMARVLVSLGQALGDADALDLIEPPAMTGQHIAFKNDELRSCKECGSETSKPCSAADCGWPTGKPVTLATIQLPHVDVDEAALQEALLDGQSEPDAGWPPQDS